MTPHEQMASLSRKNLELVKQLQINNKIQAGYLYILRKAGIEPTPEELLAAISLAEDEKKGGQ